jgi:hypothetical protein
MRRFQAPAAAKSQGDVDDPRTNLSVRNSISIGYLGSGSDSQYRMRYFIIGISVLCLSTFLVIHFLVSTRIRNTSSLSLYSNRGDRISSVEGSTLSMCWDKTKNASFSEWKATLVGRFRNAKSHDYDGIHVFDLMEKKLQYDSIRREPRYFYDVSHLYDAAHGSATSQDMRKVPRKDILDTQKNSSSSSTSLQNEKLLSSAAIVTSHRGGNSNSNSNSDSSNSAALHLNPHVSRYHDSVKPDAGVCVKESDSLGFRCLPSFLIIGAMKSGTGQLMDWLNLHPNLQSGRDYKV